MRGRRCLRATPDCCIANIPFRVARFDRCWPSRGLYHLTRFLRFKLRALRLGVSWRVPGVLPMLGRAVGLAVIHHEGDGARQVFGDWSNLFSPSYLGSYVSWLPAEPPFRGPLPLAWPPRQSTTATARTAGLPRVSRRPSREIRSEQSQPSGWPSPCGRLGQRSVVGQFPPLQMLTGTTSDARLAGYGHSRWLAASIRRSEKRRVQRRRLAVCGSGPGCLALRQRSRLDRRGRAVEIQNVRGVRVPRVPTVAEWPSKVVLAGSPLTR